jgi:Flp pilus assembly protein TadG
VSPADGCVSIRQGHAQRGQALVELALVLPVLLFLAFAIVSVGRVMQARLGVSAVAREAARAGAQAGTRTAVLAGYERGQVVAQGYGLTNGTLQLSVSAGHAAPGGTVSSTASYEVRFTDLPLLGWAHLRVSSEAREAIDLYRSAR